MRTIEPIYGLLNDSTLLFGLSSDRLDDAQTRLKSVGKVIERWLPSAHSIALWVWDTPTLDLLMARLDQRMTRVATLAERGQNMSTLPAAITELQDVAFELDRFLNQSARGVQSKSALPGNA